MPFKAIYKPNLLIAGDPESRVGVVTLWTPREKVAAALDPACYAAVGQLYSATRGLDLLVRNLLANPQIRYLLMTGHDLSRSGEALRDFFAYGVDQGATDAGRPCWRVRSATEGYVDVEVPQEAIDRLRAGVQLVPCQNTADTATEARRLRALSQDLPPYAQPETYPKVQTDAAQTWPAESAALVVRGPTVAETWLSVLDAVMRFGYTSATHYESRQREAIDLVAVVTDEDPDALHLPDYLPVRGDNLARYIPQVLTADVPADARYTYGSRLRAHFQVDQVENMVARLAADPDSRSAVASLWDPRTDGHGHGTPCLNQLWARLRDGHLSLTAVVRSNDMYGAWPSNALALRKLQELIRCRVAQERGEPLGLGDLITLSESAHVYEENWAEAEKLLASHRRDLARARNREYDPRGAFVIEVKADSLAVEHIDPDDGEHLRTYAGKNAADLERQIATDQVVSSPGHALYLGRELAKAEVALRWPQLFEYTQDSPLRLRDS